MKSRGSWGSCNSDPVDTCHENRLKNPGSPADPRVVKLLETEYIIWNSIRLSIDFGLIKGLELKSTGNIFP